jgi:hypothetical protein
VEIEVLAGEDIGVLVQVDSGEMGGSSWREIEPRRAFIAGQKAPCLRSRCQNLICCFQKKLLLSSASPSQQIDLWFTKNIGCAEFGESISDPLAPWCISKDVVFFFVSHDQANNILGLCNPNLLQIWEATHEIPPSAFATWRSENPECQTQADQKSPSRESGKTHS